MISGQLVPIRRDLDVAFSAWVGPPARAAMLADYAREVFAEVEATNADALGHVADFLTIVDGRRTENLDSVRPDGVITRVYDVLPVLLTEIGQMLWEFSPVLTGAYQRSHRLLADGEQVAEVSDGWQAPAVPAQVQELLLVPTVVYARLLEPVDGRKPWSKKAPDGVYHVVAEMMRPVFAKFGSLSFGYRALVGVEETQPERSARPYAPRDLRQPAIIIKPN